MGNNNGYKFGEPPDWRRVQTALTRGGLGFWRIVRLEDGSIVFDPDDTLLTLFKTQRSEVPESMDQVIDKYFYPEDVAEIATLSRDCFAGKINDFKLDSCIVIHSTQQVIHVNIFGEVEQKDKDGQVLIIAGCTQNIQEQYEAKAKLKATLEEKKSSDERNRIMLDGMPLVCGFWETNPCNRNIFETKIPFSNLPGEYAYLTDVNQAASAFYDVPDKQTYLNNFAKLSPEFQPDGQSSKELSSKMISRALQEGGFIIFEWMHQKLDGTPIPCEVTLIRTSYGDKFTVVAYTHDLRKIKATQVELDEALEEKKASAERNHIMLDGMPLVCDFWETNPQNIDHAKAVSVPLSESPGKYAYLTDVNNATLTLFDLPDKQSYIDSFHKLSPKFQPCGRSSVDIITEKINEVLHKGRLSFEWLHQKFDGTPIPCKTTLIMLPYGDGFTMVSYKSDLREIKAAQVELDEALEEKKASDNRNRIMLDSMPFVCHFWDTNPRNRNTFKTKLYLPDLPGKYAYLTYTNPAAMTLFDLPDKQTYLDDFEKLTPEFQPDGQSSKELSSKMISRALQEGGFIIFEWMHQKLDGTPIPCEVTLIRTSSGDDFTVISYMRDLRELKAAQSAMLMEQLLLKKIMDSTPICFTITVDDKIKFITPFAQEFFGCTLGDNIDDIYTSKQAYHALKAKQQTSKLSSWHTIKTTRANGEEHSMLLNSFNTNYYGESGVMSWFIDITEMLQKNQELEQAKKVAEESTKAKSLFLANMSHEIRTPMNAILGLLHLLLKSELNDLQHEYLTKTEGAAKALLRIINDILDFSKIEAGKLEMENEVFSIDEAIQSVTDMASTNIHEKGLEYIVDVHPSVPLELIGDQGRLIQILSNLLNNATKFTEHGQILMQVETVSTSPTEITLRFLVQDTGIGMTKVQAKSIFSAFAQADPSTTRRYGGTGLGLVICRRLIEIMGGELWVESEQDFGSTFGFTATFGLHTASANHDFEVLKNFQNISALVIDDHELALDCLKVFLENMGLKVEVATSGYEALSLLTDHKKHNEYFDLVFIDWKMPGMDGVETTKQIKKLIAPTELPVIIMVTAYNRDEALEAIKSLGIRTVLTKPLLPVTIAKALGDIFGKNFPMEKEKAKRTKGQEQSLVQEFKGAKILLAEDNVINQLVASSILKEAGLEVDIANNGKEAVEMTKTGQYELILMDIQMPEMDGIAATREIRAIPEFKDLPILAMTANAMNEDREASINAGMNAHISKPIDLHDMFSSLQEWLSKARNKQK